MKRIITIKKNFVELKDEDVKLEDILIFIDEIGSFRADYLMQILRDWNNMPNNFSIARKLDKYKLK